MPHLLDPPSLRSQAEYLAALDELDALQAADPGTPAGVRFDELTALIGAWESQAHPPPAAARWRLARP